MKKKEDVYVLVDTPKKAKKLKKVLDMFGESVYLNEILYNFTDERRLLHYWYGNFSLATRGLIEEHNKTEVSIKELRNILAKEHLKAGDVVFMRSFKGEYESILKIKGVEGEYLKVDKELFVKGSDFIYSDGQELIKDFIRYATEEEKALLETIDDFTDSDIAIVERLHDTLLDNHGYPFNDVLLMDVRMLANKIKSKIK